MVVSEKPTPAIATWYSPGDTWGIAKATVPLPSMSAVVEAMVLPLSRIATLTALLAGWFPLKSVKEKEAGSPDLRTLGTRAT